jgi:hypothetical protein
MAATAIAPSRRPSAEAIRDVSARPAVLLALAEAVPAAAVRGTADRRRAVTDGVARALEVATRLALGEAVGRRETVLLEEAEQRMWEPVTQGLARLLQRTGPDGLFSYLLVEGAVRREAWRADTQRRRADGVDSLSADVAGPAACDPVDLERFRAETEAVARLTVERTGLPAEIALALVARELSYAEAGRRTGRSPNSLWMALARLRPEWRDLAQRGREAGLGGGIAIDLADQSDRLVRRMIRWRLVSGVVAVLLLAAATGAIAWAGRSLNSSCGPAPGTGIWLGARFMATPT